MPAEPQQRSTPAGSTIPARGSPSSRAAARAPRCRGPGGRRRGRPPAAAPVAGARRSELGEELAHILSHRRRALPGRHMPDRRAAGGRTPSYGAATGRVDDDRVHLSGSKVADRRRAKRRSAPAFPAVVDYGEGAAAALFAWGDHLAALRRSTRAVAALTQQRRPAARTREQPDPPRRVPCAAGCAGAGTASHHRTTGAGLRASIAPQPGGQAGQTRRYGAHQPLQPRPA